MPVPQEIFGLVGRFENNREAYRSGAYNETQLRREFVDPFFKILGWDVNNEKGYAEAYKDVIHEDSIKVGGVTKAPDYCFRIGGTRKFFVETKKPSVNLKDDISPAFQLRRYAWSAKLPLSILTDFEEFAVYDCRVKPDKSDKSSTARILYLNCNEYAQRWDEIFEIFSRDAVLKGSFDKYAESSKVKKGTTSVNDAFLTEIESWRDTIARNLALRNPDLSQHDLNFTVQRTIDRIVFLRICEDRGIEQYGRLMALQNGDRVYARLCEMFRRADERYNSGLFHFQKDKGRAESPDTLTLNLAIDDSVLKNIIRNLYYPDSPYEFSVLSADILGQVYEQFLGKVIRLTAGHRAVVEEKPEVRKAGGVYYTPTYIVDYIVKNTVGKLVRAENFQPLRKTIPKDISKIRVLDPACGSGSFLLGAYQYLLDWHRDWYVTDGPEKWATGRSPTLYQAADSNPHQSHSPLIKGDSGGCQNISVQSGTIVPAEKSPLGRGLRGGSQNPNSQIRNWRLTTAERKRILLNNIYGVDIDPQAVEVTKLSLLLKVLEGESEQTLARQLKLFHERALPDLGNNIKCGNSLIGTDFYHTPPPLLSPSWRGIMGEASDEEERRKVNPFDWEAEFPEIMKPAPAGRKQGTGGFDAVIGNPPWVFTKYFDWGEDTKNYIQTVYLSDRELCGKSRAKQAGKINLLAIFVLKGLNVLKDGGLLGLIVPNNILRTTVYEVVRKSILESSKLKRIVDLKSGVFQGVTASTVILLIEAGVPVKNHRIEVVDNKVAGTVQEEISNYISQDVCFYNPSHVIDIFVNSSMRSLVNKMDDISIQLGTIVDVLNGIATYKDMEGILDSLQDVNSKPILFGKDISRYHFKYSGKYVNYIREKLLRARNEKIFLASQKLIMQRIGGILITAYDDQQYYTFNSVNNLILKDGVKYNLKYILGIINSKLMRLSYITRFTNKSSLTVNISKTFLDQLPIRTIKFLDPSDRAGHDRMVVLVDQMLELHKQLASARTDHDKTAIQRQIDATDRQIDQLVYELYGLTEEEIKIVEGG